MKKETINPNTVSKPVAPYSTAVKVKGAGTLVFLAGVTSTDINGNIVYPGDIVGQTKQTVNNLKNILESIGAVPENVVMTTTYVVASSMKEFLESGSAIECLKPFGNPADTLVGVACLAGTDKGQLIEISAIVATD